MGQMAMAAETNSLAPGVSFITFSGWEQALSLSGGDCRVVVVPAVGGRITYYSLNGDNILYEEPGSGGKTLAATPEGFPMGGYQCDLGPELPAVADHKMLALGPWRWQTPRPHTVVLESAADSMLGLQMAKKIMIDPDSGEVGLEQRVMNVAKAPVNCCLWDRTLCKGEGYALVPLNKRSLFKAGWSLARRDAAGKSVYDANPRSNPRLRVLDHVLVAETKGAALKVGADSDQGWIAYTAGRLLLVKYYPVDPKGRYSDGGNTVEVSWGEQRTELQPLSAEVTLKPGESHVFPEKWLLYDLPKSVSSFAEARALVKRIPPSPFRK